MNELDNNIVYKYWNESFSDGSQFVSLSRSLCRSPFRMTTPLATP